jgi:hypothetical protein
MPTLLRKIVLVSQYSIYSAVPQLLPSCASAHSHTVRFVFINVGADCRSNAVQSVRRQLRKRSEYEGECCASVSIQGDKHKHIRQKQFKLQLCIRTLPEGECCASAGTQGNKHKHIRHKQFKCLPLPEHAFIATLLDATQWQQHRCRPAHQTACILSNAMRHNAIALH